MWPLLLPQQRSARISTADAEVEVAQAAAAASKLRIAGDVREAAWSIALRESEAAVITAQVRTLQALAEDVERRVQAGDLARADALAVRGELAAATAADAQARQRLRAAVARWRLLTGTQTVIDARERVIAGADQHPELALAAHTAERARDRLQLTRLTRTDPPDLIVRYRHETPGGGIAEQNSVGIAVRIPFGTADRNLPRDAAAVSELEIAEAAERRLRERLDAEVATARTALTSAEQQLAAEQSRHALLSERAQLIGKSFRAGESALPEYLRALAAATQAEAGVARQRAELGLARARLNQSIGVLP